MALYIPVIQPPGTLQSGDQCLTAFLQGFTLAAHIDVKYFDQLDHIIHSYNRQVFEYTGIWMEDITHETRQGSSTFTLNSTNKLLKQYQWATGLKTGSTSKAKFCLSATATKDGIDLIAVVMGAPDYKARFKDAQTLLSYGFNVSDLYLDENTDALEDLRIEGGVKDTVPVRYQSEFRYLDTEGNSLDGVKKTIELPEKAQAPVAKGAEAGRAVYLLNGVEIGSVPILYENDVAKAVYKDYLFKIMEFYLL